MSSAAATRGTWEQDCSGLCELCYNKEAEVECASCGPVRVNSTDGGPLLQCGECSTDLHSKGVFMHHALVKISRKLWLPVEDKLGLLKQQEAMLNDRKAEISEAVKKINDNYDEALELLEVAVKELQDAIVDKKQMLINSLAEVKDQQLLNYEHVNVTCSTLMDRVIKVTSKANDCLALEARQFAEQKVALLDEISIVLEQSFPPLLSVPDLTFSLAESVAKVKRQMNHLLILPLLEKRVRAGEQVQGMVVNKLNLQGLFWLRIVRRDNDGALMVISQSIRDDLQHDRLKPVAKAIVGQLCCACFSEDKQWHRARVVTMVSTSHVKICYVDYGNYEECPVTHLRSLPDKYLFYPFQTIKCCLTNDDGVEFSREARWLFNDRTKNKIVNLHIISELSSSSTDSNDVSYLVTVKEPGEAGADISSLVLSKMKEEQNKPKHPIIHRDYRLTQQHKLAAAATPKPGEAPPNRPPSRLNTDAAEFVLDKQSLSLQQPGVLQVSQTVFHNMVGVSVTSNVAKTPSDVTSTVKNNVTAIPKEKEGRVTTSTPITDAVTTTPLGSVTTTTAGVVDNATTIAVNNVTATPTGIGSNDVDTTTVTATDNATTAPITVMTDANTTPVMEENNVTTTPTEVKENVSPSEGKINGSTVPENCVTNNVTVTPNGVRDIVTTDAQVTTGDDAISNEVKNNVVSEVTSSSTVEEKGNDKEDNNATELVDVHDSTNNDNLTCSADTNGCHGNHDCTGSIDDGRELEQVSADDVTALSLSTEDVRSHDAEVGVAGIFMIDNVAPPPNEALVAGATIEISVVSDLQSDGTFWSQLVADEETDEIFCDLMESLQSICTDLHSNQKCPRAIPLVGSFCAALFSADKIWYRALVEQVTGDKLLVRYMDYGNAEMVSRDNIVALVPKMKELPFQAFLSTMASEEHKNFTPLMCERFSCLVKTNDVFQAKVVSKKGGVVEVELTVELNNEVINVNDDVYLTDFVTTDSLHFSQAALTATDTDTKLTWTEQMEALDSPVTPTKQFPFQLTTSDSDQPLGRERSKGREKSKSHKSSPVCSVRKISNSSSRRILRRQSSSEKPSGNKKQDKKTTVSNEDSGVVPSSENWGSEESLVGGADGCKDDDQMLFVKGLPPTINIEATKELFSKYGNVKNVKLDRGRAWITMDVKGAKNAALQLRNHVMSGGDTRGLLINETDNYHYKSRYRGQGLYKRY